MATMTSKASGHGGGGAGHDLPFFPSQLSFAEGPDWTFIRERKAQISFLFGDDDHWGPLHVLEEISKQVPGITVAVERENHTHGFSCTEAGSLWVAQHVANLIKNQTSLTMQ